MSDSIGRQEVDDLVLHLRRKVERLEQQAVEAADQLDSFRRWSLQSAARVDAVEVALSRSLNGPQLDSFLRSSSAAERQVVKTVTAQRVRGDAQTWDLQNVPVAHRWKVGDRVYVTRLRFSDAPDRTVTVFSPTLVEADAGVADVFGQCGSRGIALVFVYCMVARVSAVDTFGNNVIQFDSERDLSPDDLLGAPFFSGCGRRSVA